MNIKHVELPEDFFETIGDKLEYMIAKRIADDAKYLEIERSHGHFHPDLPLDINNRHDQQFFKDAAYRCIEELSEATNCLRNRPHTQTEYLTDEEHFLEELVGDAFTYFLRMLTILGLTPEDIVKLFVKKSEVNRFRRETIY